MANKIQYRLTFFGCILLLINVQVIFCQGVGIGTTPDNKAALTIKSTTKGVYIPRLNVTQQNTLATQLTTTQKGMLVTDSLTGNIKYWDGTAWQLTQTDAVYSAKLPLVVSANNLQLNSGTIAGDLITWDGNNWVNKQPAVQHFNLQLDNRQPYTVINYCISLYGVYPSQNDADQPYVGEIFMLGCNFAPNGYAFCNGQLLAIAENEVLFNLIGTTYGGDGQTTFALPDLRGRVALHQGTGQSTYYMGQLNGTEIKSFIH